MLLCYFNDYADINEFVSFSNMIVLLYILELSLNLASRKIISIDKCVLLNKEELLQRRKVYFVNLFLIVL